MAINITKDNGREQKTTEYIADSITDIQNLPTNGVTPGSTCFVIENSALYMLNSQKQWISILT